MVCGSHCPSYVLQGNLIRRLQQQVSRHTNVAKKVFHVALYALSFLYLFTCPAAHGEGRLVAHDQATLEALGQAGLAALTYVDAEGDSVGYPGNPNGSELNIAGLCNPAGNVLGLMPHPEDHIFSWQHPRSHRGETRNNGLALFRNGIKNA